MGEAAAASDEAGVQERGQQLAHHAGHHRRALSERGMVGGAKKKVGGAKERINGLSAI